jgi:DNA-binding NtrC family response regulator
MVREGRLTRFEEESTHLGGGPEKAGATATQDISKSLSGRISMLVISEQVVSTQPLPPTGELTIGRGQKCDIVIDDPSVSRQHAVLSIGPPLTLRDLGSVNGTRVRDKDMASGDTVELALGDVIQLGNATLIVQRRGPAMRPQRLWPHDYFEVRLEEECARAAHAGSAFALLRLHCTPPLPPEAIQEALTHAGHERSVVGEYGPNEYEILLIAGADEAAEAARRVCDRLRARGSDLRHGLAFFPADGRNPDELVHRASPFPRASEPAAEAAIGAAIVADRRMQDLYRLAERIAAGNISVLILGETGVGKEVVAERVHRLSPRSAKPYLKLNCAALSETLLESELFGHERGAFTGAVSTKQGLLETAEGGTVFLDEIGELPLSLQVKLLRVIEDRMVLRVGGLKPRPLDVRFVAATNRDLEAEVARGAFRQDLFFRLNGATLVIPPLRERSSEIPDLARAFVSQASRQMNLTAEPTLSREALEVLRRYSWPGNIRELRNVVERAVLLCGTGPIQPQHLPLEKMRVTYGVQSSEALTPPQLQAWPMPTRPPGGGGPRNISPTMPAPDASERWAAVTDPVTVRVPTPEEPAEKARILQALAECAGNQTAAARLLGVSRRTLINKLELYGITRPRKGR